MSKQTTLVDYTKKRKGTKIESSVIDYCPKCGRKGLRVEYLTGMVMFDHQKQFDTFAWHVFDSCIIPSKLPLKESKAREGIFLFMKTQFAREGNPQQTVHRLAWEFCKNSPVDLIYAAWATRGYAWNGKSWHKPVKTVSK